MIIKIAAVAVGVIFGLGCAIVIRGLIGIFERRARAKNGEVKMNNILVLGFNEIGEIDKAIQKNIIDKECFLFTILCGGISIRQGKNVVERWAEWRGCPVKFIMGNDVEDLIKKLVKECDFLIIKVSETTPQWQKNLMMRIKAEGKHGVMIR